MASALGLGEERGGYVKIGAFLKKAPQTAQNPDMNADYGKSYEWPLQQEHSKLKKNNNNKIIKCMPMIEQNPPREARHSTLHATEVSKRIATSSFPKSTSAACLLTHSAGVCGTPLCSL